MTFRSRNQRFGKRRTSRFKGFFKLFLLLFVVVFVVVAFRTVSLMTVLQGKEGYFQNKAKGLESYLVVLLASDEQNNSETLQTAFLLSVDKQGPVYFLNIPANTRVDTRMEKVLLSEVFSEKGTEGLLSAVDNLFKDNLEIDNYLIIKEEGLLNLVDKLKGLTISDLSKTYTLGNITYYAGYDRNFDRNRVQHFFTYKESKDDPSYIERQIIILQGLFEQYIKLGRAITLVTGISSLDNYFITDMSIRELALFRNMLDDIIHRESYTMTIPGKKEILLEESVWIVNTESLKSVVNNIKFSQPIVDKSVINLEILNGNGISGIAARYGNLLQDLGYTNISTGNADNYNYQRTVIRYPEGYKFLAEEIAIKLDVEGELVEDSNNNKITVIIGKDLN